MYSKQLLSMTLLFLMIFTIFAPLPTTHAASLDNVINTLSASTSPQDSSGGGLLTSLFNLLYNSILSPILNIFNGGSSASSGGSPVKVTPLPSTGSGSGTAADSAGLRGKVIVVDPGHGGSNPGAVANNTRESDNNLAVGLKLRDKLTQAGAKVIMTRDTDRTVAVPGSSLGDELQARVDIAETNHADIFVSIHTNENSDTSITGATTYYPSGKSSQLATDIETALINETGAVNKGTVADSFYVLRNTTMPSTLVEMGFISNPTEASRMNSDSYRDEIAQGVFNGIAKYFQN